MRIFARDLYPLIIDFYTILLNYEKIKLSFSPFIGSWFTSNAACAGNQRHF